MRKMDHCGLSDFFKNQSYTVAPYLLVCTCSEKLGKIILEPRGGGCSGLILFTNGTFSGRDRESYPLGHKRLGAAI